jgi:prephenate dehydrogenase
LTHVLSLALVSSENVDADLANYIGDSYRDLTRIAMINEPLWSELFIENKSHLLAKISHFQATLERYKSAIEQDDYEHLEALMREAKRKRSAIERG